VITQILLCIAGGGVIGIALGFVDWLLTRPRIRAAVRPTPYRISREYALEIADERRGWPLLREVSGYYDEPILQFLETGHSIEAVNSALNASGLDVLATLIAKNLIVVEDNRGTDVSRWPIELLRIEDVTARYAAYQAYQDERL